MVGTINHIAIAVPCLRAASDEWRQKLDAEISAPQRLEEHGVTHHVLQENRGLR